MTELLFLEDSYRTSFDAKVTNVEDDGSVVLDQTLFYPTGGGQPHDIGTLTADAGSWTIVKVAKRGQDALHYLDPDSNPPQPGSQVHGEIDWERRYQLMRTHTALHVLCGVVFREFGSQVTGGNMDVAKARMDFELQDLNPERVQHIEQLANRFIKEGRGVTWRVLPREEAFQIPDLIRTKINLLPEHITEVRIVEVDGLDIQADGGTHVRNTSEVGGITITGTRSKGKQNKRLEIALSDSQSAQ